MGDWPGNVSNLLPDRQLIDCFLSDSRAPEPVILSYRKLHWISNGIYCKLGPATFCNWKSYMSKLGSGTGARKKPCLNYVVACHFPSLSCPPYRIRTTRVEDFDYKVLNALGLAEPFHRQNKTKTGLQVLLRTHTTISMPRTRQQLFQRWDYQPRCHQRIYGFQNVYS